MTGFGSTIVRGLRSLGQLVGTTKRDPLSSEKSKKLSARDSRKILGTALQADGETSKNKMKRAIVVALALTIGLIASPSTVVGQQVLKKYQGDC
jgi:hypothetical protein